MSVGAVPSAGHPAVPETLSRQPLLVPISCFVWLSLAALQACVTFKHLVRLWQPLPRGSCRCGDWWVFTFEAAVAGELPRLAGGHSAKSHACNRRFHCAVAVAAALLHVENSDSPSRASNMNSFLRNPVLAAALSSNIADGCPPEMQWCPTTHLQSPPPEARAALEAVENRATNGASEAPRERGLHGRPAASVVSVAASSRRGHVTYLPARFPPPTAWTWLPSPASAIHISVAPGTQSFATFSSKWPPGISLLAAEGLSSHEVVLPPKKGRRVVAEFAVPSLLGDVQTPVRISTLSSVTAIPLQPCRSTLSFPLFLGNLSDGSGCSHLLSFFRPPFTAAAYNVACSSSSHVTTAATSSTPPTNGGHRSREGVAEGSSAGTGTAASATVAAARAAARAATVGRTAVLTESSAGATEAAGETVAAAAASRSGAERPGKPTPPLDAAPATDKSATPDALGTRVAVLNVKVKPADSRSLTAASAQPSDEDAAAQRVIAASGDHTAATAAPTNVGAAAAEWIENGSPGVAICYGAGNSTAADTVAVWEAGTAEKSAVAGQRVAAGSCFGAAGLHAAAAAEAGKGNTLTAAAPFQGAAEGDASVSTFLRGGRAGSGGREWTDTEGGSDGQDEVIFTGSSDALFFPAFPVHRCRGVSLWDVETNERVCLGKFEETGGLLLLTPETLAKLAVSFRTPFFDGIVLRAFVAPPGGAASTRGHSQAHQHHRPDRHRHPAAPSHHSPAAARNTSNPPSPSTYAASNGRAPGSSRSSSGAPVPAAGDEAAAVTDKSSASASQRAPAPGPAQAVGASFEAVGAATAVRSPEVVRASDGEPGAPVRDRRKSVSHKQQHADEERTGVPPGEATSSVAEEEVAVSRSPRTSEALRRNEAHAPGGVKAQEYQREGSRGSIRSNPGGLGSSGRRDKEADADVRAAHGERPQRAQPGAAVDIYHVAGHRASGERGSSASSMTTGAPATGVPTRIPGVPAAAGEGDVLAGGDTGRRRSRHGGLQAHANDASGSGTAEGSERTGGRAVASDAQVLADRRARERREPQPLPNSNGSPRVAPARGRSKAAAEGVRALEGVLIDPEELLQAMEARHQQHLHASVDGQWMQLERPRQNTEYKLCIGESYWMAMKIPLEACNPFLLNRNDVVVDLVEPQQQEQLPREPAGAAGAPQGRQSRSSGSGPGAAAAATHGQQQQPGRRGGRESAAAAVRSIPGAARAGAGGETAADRESSPSRSNNLPSTPDAGTENGEVDRPRSFTGWIGNRVYDRMNWIAASAPTGLTNAVHRLADSLPTTPEEAEELGKKWSEQSLRAARAVSASTKLLMRSFKHAAAELWLFITEGRSGTSSTGGGVS